MLKKIYNKIKSLDKVQILDAIKKKWIYILIISLSGMLLISFIVGSVNNSKNNLLAKLEVALKNGDASQLSSLVMVNGKKVDKDLLQPLIDYYTGDSTRVDSTITNLKSKLESSDMELKSYKYIFWERYKIEIKTYNIKVSSNYSEGSFTINDSEYITAEGEFGEIIPGIYTVKGSLKSKYGDINTSKEMLLMKDEEIELKFPAINVMVNSEFTDGEIFINEENTGFTVRDQKEIGPVPSDGTINIHLEKDFPWGRIKGEEIAVKETTNIKLTINMENDKLKTEFAEVVNNYYKGVFKALNEEDKSLIENSTKESQDKIYEILEKKYFFLKNKYNIDEINIITEKNEYIYKDGQFRATIVVDIKYDISTRYFGIDKTSSSKSFFTKVLFVDGKWKVEDVENFSL